MKKLIIIICAILAASTVFAQDTAYVSKDKTTALFFYSPVKIVSNSNKGADIKQIENGLITLKALTVNSRPEILDVQDINSDAVYHIPVIYSYGRAGRKIQIRQRKTIVKVIRSPQLNYAFIGNELASGKRKHIADRKRSGGVKAWVDKLSLAGNHMFFRLDIRNKSNLPYDVDFVRFYIRDRKTVARMATHEQEIVPIYSTLKKKTTIGKSQQIANVFAFPRFSLSEDQALNVELYERNGNRHLYLQIRQNDLDDIQTVNPVKQQPDNSLAANTL